ncbi:ABC transporter substrate-binding protein [Actinopolymorpha alba]|uniref:ABC transporter substrate-binding protein n=1 Tax=Actinopolymorpha alba TaxID=533267 RepID=UPI00035F25EC|nr:ABC transporter substrate-binding protein [Actinopolymorpha alba]
MASTTGPLGAFDRDISRRRVLEILGLGAVGVSGLAACARDETRLDAAKASATDDGKAFHGGWPYLMPAEGGHFNLFTDVQNRVDLGAYLDLIVAPGGLWYWAEEKWLNLVCESFEFNESTFVYNVAKGLTWNTGDPITARDVEATFWCRWIMRLQEWTFIESMRVTGEHQVTFQLKSPANVLERFIIRANVFPERIYGRWAQRAKELFESGGSMDEPEGGKLSDDLQSWRPKDPKDDASEVITSGPYRYDFDAYDNKRLVLRKQDNGVLAKQVKFDQIVVYKGETADITPLVLSKTIDFATHGFPLETQQRFEQGGFRILKPLTYTGPSITFSLDKVPMFKDVKARQALAFAIDRAKAARVALGESARVSEFMAGFFDIQVREWLTEAELAKLERYEHNPGKAEQLLVEAGWRKSGSRWMTPDGRPAKFELLYPSDLLDWAGAAQNVMEQLIDFGFAIEEKAIVNPEVVPLIPTGEFELAIQQWSVGSPHPYFALEQDLITQNIPRTAAQLGRGMAFELTQNTEAFGKVDIQKLLAESGAGLDIEAQKAKVARLALIFNELLPKIPIFERLGNNAALEGVRVKEWPPDGDPIYQNAPYNDNHAVVLLYEGRLEPV